MSINYARLRSLTARKLINTLKKDGFFEERSKGATRLFKHPDGRRTTIHLHNMGQTFAIGTLKAIIENKLSGMRPTLNDLDYFEQLVVYNSIGIRN